MRGLLALVVLCVLASACSPIEAAPEIPRPTPATPPPFVTTTTEAQVVTSTSVLADAEAECATSFCLIYTIRDGARWSDGSSVTSADFVTTFTAAIAPEGGPTNQIYTLIDSVEPIDDHRVLVALKQPYASWQGLFARLVKNGDGVGQDSPTTGPFSISEWVRGDRIVLSRVTPWWSSIDPWSLSPMGTVQEVSIQYEPDVGTMVDRLLRGDADVVVGRPDGRTFERLGASETVNLSITPGPFWEHIAFRHDHPLLSQAWLRQAIALAMDRDAMLDATVRQIAPETEPLDSVMFIQQSSAYKSRYSFGYDPEAAEQILVDNFCTRDSGGPYSCQGRPLTFVWATTRDDPARAAVFDIARRNLGDIGIELVDGSQIPSTFVTREFLFGEDTWDLINFSWRSTGDPLDVAATVVCGGDLNVARSCDSELDEIIDEARLAGDSIERDRLLARVDEVYLSGPSVIPLYQKPTFVAWDSAIDGPDPSLLRDLWNIGQWTGPDRIVVLLEDEPQSLDPLGDDDPLASLVLDSLLYGAFGMTPELTALPVLVEEVEVISNE